MSHSWPMVSMQCPICRSWDTFVEWEDLYSWLYCRQCGDGNQQLVWDAQYELGVERVHYGDGSIKESIFEMTDAIRDWLHKRPKKYDDTGCPIELSYDESWPTDQRHRVKVRFFTAEEFKARWSKNDPEDVLVSKIRELKRKTAEPDPHESALSPAERGC